jgi:outer membrane protein insertion porin family
VPRKQPSPTLVALLAASLGVLAAAPAAHAATKPAAKPAAKPAPAKPAPAKPAPRVGDQAKPKPAEPADDYGPGAPPPGGVKPKGPRQAPPSARDTEEKVLVREVQVRGNQRISDDRILLSTPIVAGDKVGRSDVMDAIQRIYGMGYFADVKAGSEPVLGGERIVFQVVENPIMGDVAFEGVTKVDPAKLEALFKEMKGDIINFNSIKTAVDGIQKTYADAGYPLARVADMGVAPGGILRFRISEGKIAAIKVRGNEETKEYVVLRELTTKPGEVFNRDKVNADLRRVYNLNYFEELNIKFEPAPTADGRPGEEVVLVIDVKEKQTGSINLGAGYSTRDGILGMFSVKKDNVFGSGQQVGLDLSVSQQLRIAGELNYYNPWFDEGRTGLGGSVYVRRFNNFLADFREDRIGTSANMSKPLFGDPLTSPWRGTIGLRAERVQTFENLWTGGNPKPVYPDTGRAITVNPQGTDYITGGSLGITFDTRDIFMSPTEGWFNQFTFEPAVVNGNMPLIRGTGTMNHFIPMPSMPWAPTEKTVIAIGTRAGLIGGQVVPAYERFFSTGPYLVRGWPEFVGLNTPVVQKYGINYFQGSNAFVGSLEYRFPIFNIVSGVLFGDTGMFWDNTFKLSDLHSGYGAGLRLNTPLGPIRLDYGMSGLEQGQFHFSIGQKF